MLGSILSSTKSIAILAAVFATIGSLGAYLNFANPNWRRIGLDPATLANSIEQFPQKHCHGAAQPICKKMSDGTRWFLGL